MPSVDNLPEQLSDHSVEQVIGHVLRIGVIIAAAIVLLGGGMYLRIHGGEMPGYHVFRGEPAPLRGLFGTISAAFAGEPEGIMQLGILLLIATPVVRVIFSVYAFWRQHDPTYVMITLLVLGLLLFGLLSR